MLWSHPPRVTFQSTFNPTTGGINPPIDLSKIPGKHALALADIITDNSKLKSAIKIDFDPILPPQDPVFRIYVAFFNPGENFKITTFSDGQENRCIVACRLPEVRIKIVTEEEYVARQTDIQLSIEYGAKVISSFLKLVASITLVVTLVAFLIWKLFH
jgi:hypothetical protein